MPGLSTAKVGPFKELYNGFEESAFPSILPNNVAVIRPELPSKYPKAKYKERERGNNGRKEAGRKDEGGTKQGIVGHKRSPWCKIGGILFLA